MVVDVSFQVWKLVKISQNMFQPKSWWKIEAHQRISKIQDTCRELRDTVFVPYKGRTGGPWCLHADIHIVCLAPNAGIHQDLAVPMAQKRIQACDSVVLYPGDSRDILQISIDILDLLGISWEILGIYWYTHQHYDIEGCPNILHIHLALCEHVGSCHVDDHKGTPWGAGTDDVCGISVESMVTQTLPYHKLPRMTLTQSHLSWHLSGANGCPLVFW